MQMVSRLENGGEEGSEVWLVEGHHVPRIK
jgi:hypothetical protein